MRTGQAGSVSAVLARDVLEQAGREASSATQDCLFNVGLFLWPAEPNGLVVTGCKEGTDAASSGLREGDVIVTISGKSLAGVAAGDAAHALAGPSGSCVVVSARRDNEGGASVLEATLMRDVSEDEAIAETVAALGKAQDAENFWQQLSIACNEKMERELKEARMKEMLPQRARMASLSYAPIIASQGKDEDLEVPPPDRARLASSCFSSSCFKPPTPRPGA